MGGYFMELNMFLNYIGNCIKHMNEDIERLHSNQYNNNVVLDHLSSEVFMLESHIKYFSQTNQVDMEETQYPYQNIHANQAEEEVPRYFTLEELSRYN